MEENIIEYYGVLEERDREGTKVAVVKHKVASSHSTSAKSRGQ
jgi:hypothetical protein